MTPARKIEDDEVRWGIIGAGDVCEVKSAPAMNRIANSRLVAVMRRDAEKARDYARRHRVPGWYSDADRLIADPGINAIYVATPPDSHKALTLKAIAAGKPVYVEKPMARNHHECREMVAASRSARVPLYVAYYRRALPHFVRMKELIESAAIGDVRYVRIVLNQMREPALARRSGHDWRVDPAVSGGGYFHDLASHQLDLLDFVLGPVTTATGIHTNQAGHYEADDIVTGVFEFASGVLGTGAWCFSTGRISECDVTTIVGDCGQISYETFGDGRITLQSDTAGEQVFEFELPEHIQLPLIRTVVDDLLGRGSCPSTGATAARTSWVMDRICAATPAAKSVSSACEPS